MKEKIIIAFIFIIWSINIYGQKKAVSSEDYARFNLNAEKVEKWEDGCRTGGKKGTYEWWYFDFKIDDGTTIVVDFATRDITKINKKGNPFFFVDIALPDGTKIEKSWELDWKQTFFATDSCYIKTGKSYVAGNLREYRIVIDEDDFKMEITLKNTAISWRPKTGHMVFDDKYFFAWLPAVPEGKAEGYYILNGEKRIFTAAGYHDHNWGNYPLTKLVHHWYWSRIKFGDYSIIASDVVAEKEYGYKDFPSIVVFHNGKVVADSKNFTNYFYQSVPKPYEGKPLSENLMFIAKNQTESYTIELDQSAVISSVKLVETVIKQKAIANLLVSLGMDASYYRMSGTAVLTHINDGKVQSVDRSDKAVWEMMYFGKSME